MDAIAKLWPTKGRGFLVFLLFPIFFGFVYSSSVSLDNLLEDDNLVVHAVPIPLIDVSQGRPLFQLLFCGGAQLYAHAPRYAMGIVRAAGILVLSYGYWLLAGWLVRWGVAEIEAVCLVLAFGTLPALQIDIAIGVWVAFPHAVAILGTVLFLKGYESRSSRFWPGKGRMLGGCLLWFLAMATYQPEALVAMAMLLVPFLKSRADDMRPNREPVRFIATAVIAFAVTAVLYLLIWKELYALLLPNRIDMRYGPMAVQVPWLSRMKIFFGERMEQMLNLWWVGLSSGKAIVLGCLGVILAGFAGEAWALRRERSGPAATWRFLARWLAVIGFLVLSDSIPLLSKTPILSYVTGGALMFTVWVLFWHGLSQTASLLWPGREKRIMPWGMAFLAAAGALCAQYTTLMYTAFPLTTEQRWIRGEIRAYLAEHPVPDRIHLVGRDLPPSPSVQANLLFRHGRSEFGWSNLGYDVYSYYLLRNVCFDLRLYKPITLSVSGDGVKINNGLFFPEQPPPQNDGKTLIIDMSSIDLR